MAGIVLTLPFAAGCQTTSTNETKECHMSLTSSNSEPGGCTLAAAEKVDLSGVRTVIIGRLEWTVDNLNIPWPGSWAPNGEEALVAKYGRLYTYDMALKIASRADGWRLPTKTDVETLIAEAGGREKGAAALKVGGKTGFEALYAGFREPEDDTFRRTGQQTGFWAATSADEHTAWKFFLLIEDDKIRFYPVNRLYGDSIRLVREKR